MCGRFTSRLTWREIVALYRLSVQVEPECNLPACYDCPTTIDEVIEQRDLVPHALGPHPSLVEEEYQGNPRHLHEAEIKQRPRLNAPTLQDVRSGFISGHSFVMSVLPPKADIWRWSVR